MNETVSAADFAKLLTMLTTDHDFRRDFFEASVDKCRTALSDHGLPMAAMEYRNQGTLVVSVSKEEFLVATEPKVVRQVVALQSKHSYCCVSNPHS